MSKNGILIDVGFKTNVEEFVSDIQKEFKKIDFENIIGLSEAFDKQEKDVKVKLKELSKIIEETINGKMPNDPTKQLQALNKAVEVLSSSMKDMIKVMPASETTRLNTHLEAITDTMSELSSVCTNTTNTIEELKKATGSDISFVDKKQLTDLENFYKLIKQTVSEIQDIDVVASKKQSGNTPYKNAEAVYKKMHEVYNMWYAAQDQYFAAVDLGDINQIDKTAQSYLQLTNTLLRLSKTYERLGGAMDDTLDLSDIISTPIKKLKDVITVDFTDLKEYLYKRLNEINSLYLSMGGRENLEEKFSKSVAKEVSNNPLKVPLVISTQSSTLRNQAISIIQSAQKGLEGTPLQVEVQLLSSYKSKANQKILKEISDGLQNIDDQEIKTKMLSLIDDMNKQIDNALLFNVNVNTERATNAVKEFVNDAKNELALLSSDLAPLEPEIILTEEHRAAFQQALDEAKGEFKIQVGIMDGDDTIEHNATKKELTYLQALKRYVEEVTVAVDNKTAAFQIEEQTVDGVIKHEIRNLEELSGWLYSLKDDINSVSSAIINIADFKIEFNKESLDELVVMLNNGTIDKLFTIKPTIDEQEYKNALDDLSKNPIELNLDDSEFRNKLAEDVAKIAELPDSKTITIKVKTPSDFPLNTDEKGKVKTYYRGTNGIMSGFLSHGSSSSGTFYTDNYDVASTYKSSGKIIRANLATKNPLEIDAHGKTWSNLDNIGDAAKLSAQKIKELQDAIDKLNKAGLDSSKLVNQLQELKDLSQSSSYVTDDIVKLAKLLDYDAVIFKNIIDTMGASYDDPVSTVTVVFDDEQVRNASVIEEKLVSIAELRQKISNNDLRDITKNSFQDVLYESIFLHLDNNDFSDYFKQHIKDIILNKFSNIDNDAMLSQLDIRKIFEESFKTIKNNYLYNNQLLSDRHIERDLNKFQNRFADKIKENIESMCKTAGIEFGFQEVQSDIAKNSNFDFEIKTNADEVQKQVDSLKDSINAIPDTKTIKFIIDDTTNSVNTEIFQPASIDNDTINAYERLFSWISNSGFAPEDIFNELSKSHIGNFDDELRKILEDLKLVNTEGKILASVGEGGFSNLGALISDSYAVIARAGHYSAKTDDLIPRLKEAQELGANVSGIVAKIESTFEEVDGTVSNIIYEIQNTAKGKPINLFGDETNLDYLNATDEQIQKLITDLQVLQKVGLYVDINGDNIFYDKDNGFSFIDLATRKSSYTSNELDDVMNRYFQSAANGYEKEWKTFKARVDKISKEGIGTQSGRTKPNIEFHINTQEVIHDIDEITEHLDKIPESKDIKIHVHNDDYSNIPELSNEQGQIMKFYRGVADVYNGIISNGYLGTFVSDSLEVAEGYAGALGKVYEETIKFKNALELDAEGSDWASVLNLGNRTDDESKQITGLYDALKQEKTVIEKLIQQSKASEDVKSELIASLGRLTGEYLNETFIFDGTPKGDEDVWMDEFKYFITDLQDANIQGQSLQKTLTNLVEIVKKFKVISDDPNNMYGVHTSDEYLRYAKQFGKDGLIIKNVDDTVDQSGKLSTIAAIIHENQLSTVKLVKDIIEDSANNQDINANLETSANATSEITEAFKLEGQIVGKIIDGEVEKLKELENKLADVTKAVNAKTKAFENEGKVVDKVANRETNALNPLQNLESTYNTFKGFYDNNDLESEAGAIAALSYYKAYQEALKAKVNKKDLKQFTIGEMDDLFTGNYANYKKGIEQLDLSGVTSQIDKYQSVLDELNQPEVINIINGLSEAIRQLLDSGNTSEKTTEFLNSLNKVINNLSGNKSAEKIQKIADNLEGFKKSVEALNLSDNGFINSLSSILDKGEELKALGEVLKSTQKQIKEVAKSVKAEENYNKSSAYLEANENDIRNSINSKFGTDNILYQNLTATKDGFVQVVAMVKQANDEYKKYTLTVDENGKIQEKSINDNQAQLSKEIQQWELYKKLKESLIPGAGNLGVEGESFTPDSANWDKLVDKASEFGIELKDIEKIVRNVDRIGQESFQIFTALSRITVGMNSNGVLFQKDDVLDTSVVEKVKKEILGLSNSLSLAFKGNKNGINIFVDSLDKIRNGLVQISSLSSKNLIDKSEFAAVLKYFEDFKDNISNISLAKINTDGKTDGYLEQYKIAEQYLSELLIVLDKVSNNQIFTNSDITKVEQFSSQVKTLFDTLQQKDNKLANITSVNKLLSLLYDTMQKNSAMSKELKQRFEQLATEMREFGDSMPMEVFNEFKDRLFSLTKEMKETGQTGKSFFNLIGERATGMSASFIAKYLSLYDIIRYVRIGVNTITEIDTAMTELRKVSSATAIEITNSFDDMVESAKEYGSTVTDMINATADWSRMGYSLPDAQELAEISVLYKNVGDGIDIDTANSSLISTLQGFQLDVSEAESIIDKFNEVANNYAIDSAGIGEALQRSAASFNAANTDLSKSIALITATNEVLQNPESTGTLWKTMSARIRGASTELSELSEETDEYTESTSKLRDLIKGMTGFDIMEDENTFKDIYEIVVGIGEEWDNLTDVERASLGEALAGKRNANGLYAVLGNLETLKEVYKTAEESSGSAMREQLEYQKSIQYSLDRMKASAQEFWSTLISSDLVKDVVDFLTGALELLTEFIDKAGTLPTIIGTIMTALTAKSIFSKNGGGRLKKLSL